MKPSKHNNPDSWRRDDVNLRRALQQRNGNLPLLPEGFADRLMERIEEEEAAAASAKPAAKTKRRYLWPIVGTALSTAALLALVFILNHTSNSSQPMLAEEKAEEVVTPITKQPETPVAKQSETMQETETVVPVKKATTKDKLLPSPVLLAEAATPDEPKESSETLETTKETTQETMKETTQETTKMVETETKLVAEVETAQEVVADQPDAAVEARPDLSINPKRIRDYIGKADAKARGKQTYIHHDGRHEASSDPLLALAMNIGADGGMNSVHNEADAGQEPPIYSNGKPANYYFLAGNGYTYAYSSYSTWKQDGADGKYGTDAKERNSIIDLNNYWEAAVQYANSLQTFDDSHHHLPVTLGLSIGIPLNHRFALESGITYTRLVSTFDHGTQASYEHSHQQVHYLGIPLRAQVLIFDRRHWNLYASFGGSIELPVSTLVTHRIITKKGSENKPDTHPTAPIQLSIGGGLGVQYSITNHLGIYAEPQIQWFIPTDSEIKTYRTEHPLRFVPSLGIRWSL